MFDSVSQDLYQKATELKLHLHMQSKTDKSLLTQHSLDHTDIYSPRKSSINLTSSSTNLIEKPRISLIKGVEPGFSRRGTLTGQNRMEKQRKI